MSNTNYFAMIDDDNDFEMWQGLRGPAGPAGADGKSAYEAAQEGGYTGTEAQFNAALSEVDTALQPSDVDSALSATSTNPVQNKVITAELAEQKSAIATKAGMLVDEVSGAIASFVPDSTIDNLLGVSVAVEPVQAGSGDPSPDNVRPISGWSAVGIKTTGVNVWDGEWEIGGIDDNTGEKNTVSTQKRSKNYISVAPGSNYYMNTPGLGNAGAFAYAYDSSFGFIGRIRIGSAVHLENLAFTTPANCHYILFKIGSSSYDTEQTSINYPSTDHSYHTYTGNTYAITLGQTVYGGTLDVTGGKMYARPFFPSYNGQALVGPWISSMDVYTPGTTPTVGAQVVDMGGAVTEISLDPVTISTISGQTNNVWSDAGDVDVQYAADIENVVDKKQDAPADAGTAGQVLGLDANLAPAWMTPPSGGTTNYNELSNRPKINGVTLSGNKTSADLGISSPTVYHFFYNNGYLSCSEISPVNFVRMSPETNNFQVVCYSDVHSFPNIVTYTSWAFGGIVFGDDYYQIQFFVSYLTEDASVRTAVMYVIYNPSTDSGKSWNQLFVNIVESY